MLSIRNQSCPNPHCSQYGEHEKGDQISIHSKKEKRFQCKICLRTWVSHKNEALYRIRSSPEKIEYFHRLYQQGSSIREIATSIRISPSTVQRWQKRFDS